LFSPGTCSEAFYELLVRKISQSDTHIISSIYANYMLNTCHNVSLNIFHVETPMNITEQNKC